MDTRAIDSARRITAADLVNEQQQVGIAGSPVVVWVPHWSSWAIYGIAGVLAPPNGHSERFGTLQEAHDCLAWCGINRYLVKGPQSGQ